MLPDHGGNIREIIDSFGVLQDKIIDFSSNINPLRPKLLIKSAAIKDSQLVSQYPDPECRLARTALSNYLEVDKDNILLGNGSNELIHLIPRALKCHKALIYQPTFSEYELSIRLSGMSSYSLISKEGEGFSIEIKKIMGYVSQVNLIFLGNPNNPTGLLLKKDSLLGLISACERFKTYLVMDEVFIEFVDEGEKVSLVKEAVGNKYLLVLRSLTKFFCLAGLRIGYLVTESNLIRKVNLFQPTWSVNSLAQEVISNGLFDLSFIKKSKKYIKREREFLFNQLKEIKGIQPYLPAANFILCKILDKRINAESLFKQLIKYNILIRNCSNFKGLDNKFFRIAVRKRKENLYLIQCLKEIFEKSTFETAKTQKPAKTQRIHR